MPETNVQVKTNYAKAMSIDFVESFGKNITTLLQMLAVQRKLALPSGTTIKTYTSTVTLDNTVVAPGAVIPLSQVKTEPGPTYDLVWDKKRMAVPMEVIQQFGMEQAVAQADEKLLREIQKGVRAKLFTQLKSGTTDVAATNLQEAFAKAWATIQTKFEDDGAETIVFVHPNDIADHLGSANLTTQTIFGLTFVTGFTGVKVAVVSPGVDEGVVYATAPENLVMAYAMMAGGEIDKVFDFTVEETGLIGVTHDINVQRLTAETVTAYGLILFAERLDGIAKIAITPPEVPAG